VSRQPIEFRTIKLAICPDAPNDPDQFREGRCESAVEWFECLGGVGIDILHQRDAESSLKVLGRLQPTGVRYLDTLKENLKSDGKSLSLRVILNA
jgi:hypothetical protein